MVFVLFFVLPTWTVTYGSLEPVLSLACRPCAHTTEEEKQTEENVCHLREKFKYIFFFKWWTPVFGSHLLTYSPVMLIFADHLEVPSRTLCLICFICVPWFCLSTPNTSWICSKISGLFLSLIFMRSFRTMMMFWVRSSAPCLELFSAAPDVKRQRSARNVLNMWNIT